VATSIRLELNSAGMKALLTSAETQRMIEATAEDVAQRARGRSVSVEGDPGEVQVPIDVVKAHGGTRARALVVLDHPAGSAVESKHRVLGSALG
jgi:hypothetical protein